MKINKILNKNEFSNLIKESVKRIIMEEVFNNNDNYTHFAVNKNTNLIVNGWDYSDVPAEDLRTDKRYYFFDDLIDNDFNPRDYKIWTYKHCVRNGVDPDNNASWSNDGLTSVVDNQEA